MIQKCCQLILRSIFEPGQGPQRDAEQRRAASLRNEHAHRRLRQPGLRGVPDLRRRDGLQNLSRFRTRVGKQERTAGKFLFLQVIVTFTYFN